MVEQTPIEGVAERSQPCGRLCRSLWKPSCRPAVSLGVSIAPAPPITARAASLTILPALRSTLHPTACLGAGPNVPSKMQTFDPVWQQVTWPALSTGSVLSLPPWREGVGVCAGCSHGMCTGDFGMGQLVDGHKAPAVRC